jgi:endonuclease/exonuclease/phosphatase family metal-dependent hydrolase
VPWSPAPRAVAQPAAIPLARRLGWLSWLNLAAVLAVWGLQSGLSDDYWISTAMLYIPRSPYLLPSLILLPFAWRWNRDAAIVNGIAMVLVVGPIMGLRVNPAGWLVKPPADAITVVSCNVQFYKPDFQSAAQEIFSYRPDVVAFQDSSGEHALLEGYLRDWNVYREGEFLVASRFPLKHIATCDTKVYDRISAVMCEVTPAAPARPFRVVSLHHMSPREGLSSIRPRDLIAAAGERTIEQELAIRQAEASGVRDFVETHRGEFPLIVMGDFNLPVESNIYKSNWGDLSNSFDEAGIGYGYTILCTTRSLWPAGFPWCRVDQIVASPEWFVQRAWSGSSNGSDHRCVGAVLTPADDSR